VVERSCEEAGNGNGAQLQVEEEGKEFFFLLWETEFSKTQQQQGIKSAVAKFVGMEGSRREGKKGLEREQFKRTEINKLSSSSIQSYHLPPSDCNGLSLPHSRVEEG
jgi:hypothetical protein